MTTIHHRPVHLNLWWYVAAAVLAGAVLALILATLQFAGPATDTQTRIDHPVGRGDYTWNPSVCFARHPVPNIELSSCHGRVG
jgi:hypothetical protein